MRSSVEEALEARGKTYGDFMLGTSTEALILQVLMNNHEANCKEKLNPLHVIWLTKIIQKLVRLSVTPDHSDSYRDIAGYASLILAETLGAEGRSARQKKAHANRTPERRSEIAIKSRNTRRTNAKS